MTQTTTDHKIHGAYVQAWVWVDTEQGHNTYSDDDLRDMAMTQYEREGEVEIDEGAPVSRSDEVCEECT